MRTASSSYADVADHFWAGEGTSDCEGGHSGLKRRLACVLRLQRNMHLQWAYQSLASVLLVVGTCGAKSFIILHVAWCMIHSNNEELRKGWVLWFQRVKQVCLATFRSWYPGLLQGAKMKNCCGIFCTGGATLIMYRCELIVTAARLSLSFCAPGI